MKDEPFVSRRGSSFILLTSSLLFAARVQRFVRQRLAPEAARDCLTFDSDCAEVALLPVCFYLMAHVPGTRASGKRNTTCAKLELSTGRTASAGRL